MHESRISEAERLALLRQARGMWKDRSDFADVSELRRESDERIARFFGGDAGDAANADDEPSP